MAVLDHGAFPHILSSVIDHAPRSSLLQLRGVCRKLRDTADIALAAHLVVRAGSASVTGRGGALPILRRGGVKNCESIYVGIDSKIVDIVGPVGPHPRHPVIAKLNFLGGVDTVRFSHPPAGALATVCVLSARNMVVFATLTESHGISVYGPAIAHVVTIPHGTRRAILNLRYDPNRPWLPQAQIEEFTPPESCAEVVFIFTEKATHREPQVGGGNWAVERLGGMIHGVLAVLANTRHRDIAITLVDVQKLRPVWLGYDDVVGGIMRDVEQLAEARMVENEDIGTDYSALHTSSIRFMSRDEYRAEVGDRIFELETVE